jgi:hypothetical protein
MSRNLLRTDCYFCNAVPELTSEPVYISPDQAGSYYSEYEGMIVADAICPACGALYLAWVDETTKKRKHPGDRAPDEYSKFVDLSFLSTFNDEPDPYDLPVWYVNQFGKRMMLIWDPESMPYYGTQWISGTDDFSRSIKESQAKWKARRDAELQLS